MHRTMPQPDNGCTAASRNELPSITVGSPAPLGRRARGCGYFPLRSFTSLAFGRGGLRTGSHRFQPDVSPARRSSGRSDGSRRLAGPGDGTALAAGSNRSTGSTGSALRTLTRPTGVDHGVVVMPVTVVAVVAGDSEAGEEDRRDDV